MKLQNHSLRIAIVNGSEFNLSSDRLSLVQTLWEGELPKKPFKKKKKRGSSQRNEETTFMKYSGLRSVLNVKEDRTWVLSIS